MSLKTGSMLIVLVAIVPTVHADVILKPVSTAMLETGPPTNPTIRLITQSPNAPLVIREGWPFQDNDGSFVHAGMAFDLDKLDFLGPSTPTCELVFSTVMAFDPKPHGNHYFSSVITYGMDSTETFSISNFFGSSPPPAPAGVAGYMYKDTPDEVLVRLDVTDVVRRARLFPGPQYLKFWALQPGYGKYWVFKPTLSVVPEPATIVLMGLGLSGVGLLGWKRWREGQAA